MDLGTNISNPIDTFKCSKCDFDTESKQGLKTHITRTHTVISNEVYI